MLRVQDGSSPVAGAGGDSSTRKGAVRLSIEWISEHAAQITHMLPGGNQQHCVL